MLHHVTSIYIVHMSDLFSNSGLKFKPLLAPQVSTGIPAAVSASQPRVTLPVFGLLTSLCSQRLLASWSHQMVWIPSRDSFMDIWRYSPNETTVYISLRMFTVGFLDFNGSLLFWGHLLMGLEIRIPKKSGWTIKPPLRLSCMITCTWFFIESYNRKHAYHSGQKKNTCPSSS